MSLKNKKDATLVIENAITSHGREGGAWERAKNTEDYVIKMRPPFSDDELKEDGANWASNFNYGFGKAEAKSVLIPNSSEVRKAISLLSVDFEKFNKSKHGKKAIFSFLENDEMREAFSERVSEVLSEFIEAQPSLDVMISKAEYMILMFGYACYVIDRRNIVPNIPHFTEIAFEDHTEIHSPGTLINFSLIKGDFLFDILMKMIDSTEENVKALSSEDNSFIFPNGWNREELIKIICYAYNQNDRTLNAIREIKNERQYKFSSWEDIQTVYNHGGEMWCKINTNNIHVARIFKQSDNGVEEVLVARPGGQVKTESTSPEFGVMFYRFHSGKKTSDFVGIVTDYSLCGSQYIHDIEGAGKMLAEFSLRYDTKRNNIEDKLLLSGAPWVDSKSTLRGKGGIEVKIVGGMVVSDNISLLPNQQRMDLEDHLNSMGQEVAQHDRLFGTYKPNTRLSNRPTKEEVNFVNHEASIYRNSDIPVKLKGYENIIFGIVKILQSGEFMSRDIEDCRKKFFSMLEDEFRDIDLSLDDVKEIFSTVNCVDILPVMSDREAISQAMNIASTAKSRKRLTKMYLMTYGFNRKQIRDIISVEEFGRDAETVAFENAVFEQTQEVAFGMNQDHVLHLNGHFYKVDSKLKGISSGEDPVRAFNFIRNCLTNTRLHITALVSSYFFKSKAKDYIKMQEEFEKQLKKLGNMLQEMQKEAANNAKNPENQTNVTEELKNKFYLDRIKLMNKLETANARTKHAQELSVQRMEFNNRLKEKQVEFDNQQKSKKTQAEIDASLAKKAAEMS